MVINIPSMYPDVAKISSNRLVPYYLMSSYLYYDCDKFVLEDTDYDLLCKRLLNEWDKITHMHKHLIDPESLKAGTGFGNQYTNMVKMAAHTWYNEYEKETK